MRLSGIEAEQPPLPGLKPARIDQPIQSPLMNEVTEDESLAADGQMSLGADQPPLQPITDPVQLVLLGDPAPWEMVDEPPSPKPKGRLERRRRRQRIIPGQTRLF